VAAAKTARAVSRRLHLGGGTALPGLIAERIDPGIIGGLAAQLGRGSVLVTGTNGKTTTARLLGNALQSAGLRVVANRAGSNMMRGIASALVESAGLNGRLRRASRLAGVFEVDEATLPYLASAVKPKAIVFTNLFRDQLDRYGEVEYVAGIWRETANALPPQTILVLNADDPSVASLADSRKGRVIFFGVRDTSWAQDSVEHAADARWCSACGGELHYSAVFYAHLGHWRCPACSLERPAVDASAAHIQQDGATLQLEIWLPNGQVTARLPLMGLYTAYNALAAAAGAVAFGVGREHIESGFKRFTAAFGRQERLSVAGRHVQVMLAKNPAGLNQVLRTIAANGEKVNAAFFLNDGIADGRDISWIWDVDFELLAGRTEALMASGNRAWDMALRLKYASLGIEPEVEKDPASALHRALERTPDSGTLYVVPTYTAMLQVRDLLARWGGRGAFWEESADG